MAGRNSTSVCDPTWTFNRLDLYAKIQKPPEVKFKDLEAVVTSRLVRDQVKFQYRTNFLRITSWTMKASWEPGL